MCCVWFIYIHTYVEIDKDGIKLQWQEWTWPTLEKFEFAATTNVKDAEKAVDVDEIWNNIGLIKENKDGQDGGYQETEEYLEIEYKMEEDDADEQNLENVD